MTPEPAGSVANCQGTRIDGEPCGSVIVGPSGYCFAHDPEAVEDRLLARQRGGYGSSKLNRARRLAPPALVPVFDRLMEALEQTHRGILEPARAQALASLSRAAVTVITAGELETRLRAIEEGMR